jgi:hypothetical protein
MNQIRYVKAFPLRLQQSVTLVFINAMATDASFDWPVNGERIKKILNQFFFYVGTNNENILIKIVWGLENARFHSTLNKATCFVSRLY